MTDDEGLRARKQRATRETIHRVAIRRALADGLDAVTVAEISTEAGVSPRTFFNYFPTKEDAMLGFHEGLPTEEDLEAFARSDASDLLSDLLHLMWNVLSASPVEREGMRDRRKLLQQHPQLLQRQLTRVFTVEQRIVPVVAERMRTHPRFRDLTDHTAAAQMLAMLAISSIRIAIRNATASPQRSSAAGDDGVLETTLTTLREVASRIQ